MYKCVSDASNLCLTLLIKVIRGMNKADYFMSIWLFPNAWFTVTGPKRENKLSSCIPTPSTVSMQRTVKCYLECFPIYGVQVQN